jgi:exonuclease SbcC
MRLKKISILNFLSYSEAIVDLEDLRKVLIVGVNNNDATNSNGSGKTNLCEAISFAVWGKSKAKTLDMNVKEGEKSCTVEIDFEHDGKQCTIKRTYKLTGATTGTTSLDFTVDGVTSNGKSATDTNKNIIDLIKVDYLTYVNSVYLRQDDIFSLANPQKSGEGRSVIESVLRLSEYDKYEKLTKKKIKEAEKNLTESNFFLETNKDTEKNLDEIRKQIVFTKALVEEATRESSVMQEKLKTSEAEYMKEKESFTMYDSMKAQVTRAEQAINSKNNELESNKRQGKTEVANREARKVDLQKKIGDKEQIEKSRDAFLKESEENYKLQIELNELLEKIKEEKAKLKEKSDEVVEKALDAKGEKLLVANTRKNMDKITESVKNIKVSAGDMCDICMSDVTDDNIDRIKAHYKEEYIKQHESLEASIKLAEECEANYKALQEEQKAIEVVISGFEKRANEIRPQLISDTQRQSKLEYFADSLSQIIKYENQLKELPEDKIIAMLGEKVANLKKEIEEETKHKEELDSKLAGIKLDSTRMTELEKTIRNMKSELDAVNGRKYTHTADVTNMEKSITQLSELLVEYKKREEMASVGNEDVLILGHLEKAFGSKGVRAKILEDAIRDLEIEADTMLKRFSNGRLSLTFVTEKSDKVVFDILINDGEKTLPFSLFSGGEKFRIAFVLRIALAKLLLRKSNSKMEFLIIDEAVSPLDQNGVENVMTIINELQDEFKTIMVITHRNDIKNMFDKVITVHRDETGSRIL